MKQVTVLGGSGFLGSALVAQLSAANYSVNVLTRRREASKHLTLLPNVQVIECDVLDARALNAQLKNTDIVVNLIGILHESKKCSFDKMHVQLPQKVADLCVKAGIKRLIHMSALQASTTAPSAYLRSRGAGEEAVSAYKNVLNLTIFRPSVIFGRGDSFFSLFANLVKYLPIIALAKPNAKFQPVWVEDVAKAITLSLENIDTYNQTYELAGPRVYTFKTLIEFVMVVLGKTRPIIGLNDTLSYAQAFAMELLPVKLMTRDNVKSMEVDSVSNSPFPALFGFEPTAMEVVVPEYLGDDTPRASYEGFRSSAGR